MRETLVICCIAQLVLGDLSLLILHTNDMHARFEQVDQNLGSCKEGEDFCYGGFARLNAMKNYFKKKAEGMGRSTLFLNAGDTFQGTSYFTEYKWKLTAKMVDMLELDAMTLGNHEFDDGIDDLASYIDHVNVPVVCSNLDLSEAPSFQRPNLYSSKVLMVNGTKVGIVGYVIPFTNNSQYLGGMKISDEISSVRKEARKLRDEGVQIIIALGHSGYDKDIEIAKKVEDIDVVVGGHSHTFLYSGVRNPELEEPSGPYPTLVAQESGKQVPVVQAYYGTKYLGYLELDFDNEGNLKTVTGSPILLFGLFPQDPNVLRELEPFKAEKIDKLNRLVGYTDVFLSSNNSKCKNSECEIGNLIADAYADHMTEQCPSLTINVALMNAGGIRSSLEPVYGGQNGSITLDDVMAVVPWGEPLVAFNMSGKVLMEVLEHSVSGIVDIKTSQVNNFLQVSGLRITYNLAKKVGKRVSHVKVRCKTCKVTWFQRLKLDKYYGVVVPEHLANGGDGFSMLINSNRECVSEDVDHNIVARFIEKNSPIKPDIEGRIQVVYGEISDIIIRTFYCLAFLILVLYAFRRYRNSRK